MPRFIYKAKTGPKDLKEGVIEADTERAAAYKISQLGYFPIELREEKSGEKTPFFSFGKKVKWKDLSVFTRQLADLLASGVTILKALEVLSNQTDSSMFRMVIDDVRTFVRDGGTFSNGLARHPGIFSGIYVSMVKAGEAGGDLEQVLNRLADYAQTEDQLISKVRSAMAYPVLMAVVGLGTIIILLAFVIPRIVTIFQDINQSLPLPTLILINLSSFLVRYGWIVLLAILITAFIIYRQSKTSEGKFIIDKIKIKVPVAGNIIIKTEIARFTKTLSTLLVNGVPMMQALKIAGSVVDNESIRRDVEYITKEVLSGAAFSKAIIEVSQFPVFVTNMIAVGDESGHLEKALLKVSESCERDVDRLVRIFTALIEPVIILVMGGVVGFIVVSMLLPIFQINLMVR